MSDKKDEYPLTTLHTFLREASTEFGRFRLQAKVNLIGSIILLILLSRLFLFVFGDYGPPLFHREHIEHTVDVILLLASLGAISWSVYVFLKQRKFVSRWGERFEKLETLEKQLLPDEPV
jgi:hypothetical protein